MADLQADLIINAKLDKIEAQLNGVQSAVDTKLRQVGNKGGNAAKGIGAQIGQSLGNGITSYALRFIAADLIIGKLQGIIGGYISLGKEAFNISQNNAKAENSLAFSIKSVNEQANNRNRTLKSESASYEEKARALGISNDEMYEEVKASKASGQASNDLARQKEALEKSILDQTRRFEDNTKAINDNIRKIDEQTRKQVEAVRRLKGFEDLTKQQKNQQGEILELTETKLEQEIAGDKVAAFFTQQQIELKQRDLDLTEVKIKQIDRETKSIEELADVEIQRLRAELEKAKNVFEIDTEPAKRAIEDLGNQISNIKMDSFGGGSSFKPKQAILDLIENEKTKPPKILNEGDLKAIQTRLFEQTKGILPKAAIAGAIDDLLLSGLTGSKEIEDTLNRFVDISVKADADVQGPYNRIGNAVLQLGEQFRTQRAELGETAGLTQEYGTDIIPAGIAKLEEMKRATGELAAGQKLNFDSLSEGEQAQAKYLGLLDVTTTRQEAFKTQLQNGDLAADELGSSIIALKTAIGEQLGPEIKDIIKELIPLVKDFANFVSTNEDFKNSVKDIFSIVKELIGFIKNNKDTIGSFFEGAGKVNTVISNTRKGILGFSEGGYTGDVGTNQVAGVVHGQEFVFPADIYRQFKPVLDGLYSAGKGGSSTVGSYNNTTIQNQNFGSSESSGFTPSTVLRG